MHRIALRLAATAVAVLLGCLALSTVSATAHPLDKHHVKISAGPVKNKVHKGDQVRIHGHLASADGPRLADVYDTLYLQEETQAGVWVNLADTSCEPDNDFDIRIDLNVSATLRVFAPETDLYASATSSVFALIVI